MASRDSPKKSLRAPLSTFKRLRLALFEAFKPRRAVKVPPPPPQAAGNPVEEASEGSRDAFLTLLGGLGPSPDDLPGQERLLAALERIAIALEFMSGLQRPGEEPLGQFQREREPYSAVSYLSDEEEFVREERKEAYYRRTGKRLGPEEDVPRPTKDGWPSPRGEEEAPEGD